MIYEDQTALIRKGLFEVQHEVGLGRQEEVYHKALTLWFQKEGIPFASKEPHPLLFSGLSLPDSSSVGLLCHPWNKLEVSQ